MSLLAIDGFLFTSVCFAAVVFVGEVSVVAWIIHFVAIYELYSYILTFLFSRIISKNVSF